MTRVRYKRSSDAPKLLATAIALGINNVTTASSEALKLNAISKLQDDTATYTNTETNAFIEALGNKVLLQVLFHRLQFKDPISRMFFKQGISISAAKEVIDAKLLTDEDYDGSKFIYNDDKKAKTLNTILVTQAKKLLRNTVATAGLQAAFSSDQAYGEWLAKQTDLLAESLQVILFKRLSPVIQSGIKNEITLSAKKFGTWDKIFIEINRISERMASLPSNEYNLGFATPQSTPEKTRVQILPKERQLLISSPDVINALNGEVSTVKFHNAYFDIKKYGDVLKLDMKDSEIILCDKEAFTGYFRVKQVSSQFWAANLKIEYFLHYWYVFGSIPWANGVKFKFTVPSSDAEEMKSITPSGEAESATNPLG